MTKDMYRRHDADLQLSLPPTSISERSRRSYTVMPCPDDSRSTDSHALTYAEQPAEDNVSRPLHEVSTSSYIERQREPLPDLDWHAALSSSKPQPDIPDRCAVSGSCHLCWQSGHWLGPLCPVLDVLIGVQTRFRTPARAEEQSAACLGLGAALHICCWWWKPRQHRPGCCSSPCKGITCSTVQKYVNILLANDTYKLDTLPRSCL